MLKEANLKGGGAPAPPIDQLPLLVTPLVILSKPDCMISLEYFHST